MKPTHFKAALLIIGACGVFGHICAAEQFDFGKGLYDSKCAVCHGMTGRGDGIYAGLLKTSIPDLTALSKSNGGVFPFQRVSDVIDGRTVVPAHGSREMPIWGRSYTTAPGEAYSGIPYQEELYVRIRILALTEYIHRLQVK